MYNKRKYISVFCVLLTLSDHMRPMPIDDIGTVVDTEVSQFTQGSAVLAKEGQLYSVV